MTNSNAEPPSRRELLREIFRQNWAAVFMFLGFFIGLGIGLILPLLEGAFFGAAVTVVSFITLFYVALFANWLNEEVKKRTGGHGISGFNVP